tara:strand:- start:3550 stop:4134 length:585 start_codon:yes stop_codon:yes gene_type:complete
MQSNTQIPKNVGASISSRYDDRKGLGYGQLDQKFQKSRPAGNSFPYKDLDNYEESDDVNDESHDAVSSKVYDYPKTDAAGDAKATDPLYFVGAATKLHACFEKSDEILCEIEKASKMIPVFDIIETIGGYDTSKAFDIRSYRRTGTKKGWSERPPVGKDEYEKEIEEDEFYNLKDLSAIQRPTLGECFDFLRHT